MDKHNENPEIFAQSQALGLALRKYFGVFVKRLSLYSLEIG